MTNQQPSYRYILTRVEVPKGENGMLEMASGISQYARSNFNRNCESVLVKGELASPLFEDVKQRYEDNKLTNEFIIHNAIQHNITSLVTACKGNTWFSNLDNTIRQVGSVDKLFTSNKPNFRINLSVTSPSGETTVHTYFFKRASVEKQPYSGVQPVVINGSERLLYLYTFEFNPNKNSPELQDCLGTKHQYPNAQDPNLLNRLKDEFCSMAGWGTPAIQIASNDEEIWYDQSRIRMGLEGNKVHVLGPSIDTFEDTIQQVLQAKLAWVNTTRATPPVQDLTSSPSRQVTLE